MTHLIAICGGSGSGKTFISRALRDNLPCPTAILSYDSYYRDQSHLPVEERDLLNYDDPAMLDEELLLSHLSALREGKSIDIPQYDFSSHTRMKVTRPFSPKDIVIIEGIMVMQLPKDTYDYVIYVDAESDVRLARRLQRDLTQRGRTAEGVIKQYLTSVKPMHLKYVEPAKKKADFIFENDENDGLDERQMTALLSDIREKLFSR